MEVIIFAVAPFVVGVIFGTQLVWVWQVAAVFLAITYFNSSHYSRLEIGGIVPAVIAFWFFIGMIVGDISWAIQTEAWNDWDIGNPFTVN